MECVNHPEREPTAKIIESNGLNEVGVCLPLNKSDKTFYRTHKRIHAIAHYAFVVLRLSTNSGKKNMEMNEFNQYKPF